MRQNVDHGPGYGTLPKSVGETDSTIIFPVVGNPYEHIIRTDNLGPSEKSIFRSDSGVVFSKWIVGSGPKKNEKPC